MYGVMIVCLSPAQSPCLRAGANGSITKGKCLTKSRPCDTQRNFREFVSLRNHPQPVHQAAGHPWPKISPTTSAVDQHLFRLAHHMNFFVSGSRKTEWQFFLLLSQDDATELELSRAAKHTTCVFSMPHSVCSWKLPACSSGLCNAFPLVLCQPFALFPSLRSSSLFDPSLCGIALIVEPVLTDRCKKRAVAFASASESPESQT